MSFKPIQVTTKSGVKLSGLFHASDAPARPTASALAATSFVMFGPHPKLGGSMRDRVIFSTAHAIAKLGARSVLLLDFKGVGSSEGSGSWTGTGEREDVIAGIDFVSGGDTTVNVALVGYSFGSAVSSSVFGDARVRAIGLVSPPWGFISDLALGHHYTAFLQAASEPSDEKRNVFIAIGAKDQFAGLGRVEGKVEELQKGSVEVQLCVRDTADHFWGGPGDLQWLHEKITTWLTRVFP